MQKRFGIRCCVHRRGIRLLVGWINTWLNELTGKKVSCWKETMEINKVFGLILLLIIDCFIFQCVWACMFKLSKLVLRASPHWVSSYDTLSPPYLFNQFFTLSNFDFKFAYSWGPSHIGPRPTHPHLLGCETVFASTLFCVFLYNRVLAYLYCTYN